MNDDNRPALDRLPPHLQAALQRAVAEFAARRPQVASGRYQFFTLHRAGGMGEIWKGWDHDLQREVAFKIPLANPENSQAAASLLAEARILAQLGHRAIVPVHDVGTLQDGRPFLVMTFIAGSTLQEHLQRRKSLRDDELLFLQYFEEICGAVARAHSRNPPILHRDLNPMNIVVSDLGGVFVLDWGIARFLAEPTDNIPRPPQLTVAGKGTWGYMAPEQARGLNEQVGPASDVFGLGALLCAVLIGQQPYPSLCRTDEMETQLATTAGRLASCRAPAELIALASRCLAPNPEDRPRDAASVLEQLQAARRTIEERRQAQSIREAARRRWRRLGAILAVVAVILGGWIAFLWQEEKAARHTAESARYRLAVRLAHEELARGRLANALAMLEECPERHRRWEWHYLFRRCHPDARVLSGHRGEVHDVAFSPEGDQIATIGQDRTARFWDAHTGRLVQTVTIPGATDGSERFTIAGLQAGEVALLMRTANEARFWSVTQTGNVRQLPVPGAKPNRSALAPSGLQAALVTQENTIEIHSTGKRIRQGVLPCPDPPNRALAFSANGERLLALGPQGVTVWDIRTGKVECVFRGHQRPPAHAYFARDGSHVGSATALSDVRADDRVEYLVWELPSGKILHRLADLPSNPSPGAICGKNKTLAFAFRDGGIRCYDLTAPNLGSPTIRYAPSFPSRLAFHPKADQLATTGTNEVLVWDLAKPQLPLRAIAHNGLVVFAATPTPDGRFIVSGGGDGSLEVRGLTDGKLQHRWLAHDKIVFAIACRPGHSEFASAGRDGLVKRWSWETGKCLGMWQAHQGDARSVAYSSDGTLLASAGEDGVIRSWSIASDASDSTVHVHPGGCQAVAYRPDGLALASVGNDGTVQVHHREDHSVLFDSGPLRDHLACVAWSPDGRYLAAAGHAGDCALFLWDLTSGKSAWMGKGHTLKVTSLAFSPDGSRLVSGSDDKTIRIWDVTGGQELLTLREHRGGVSAVAFTADGEHLISAGWHGELIIRDGRRNACLPVAHDQMAGRWWRSMVVDDRSARGRSPSFLAQVHRRWEFAKYHEN